MTGYELEKSRTTFYCARFAEENCYSFPDVTGAMDKQPAKWPRGVLGQGRDKVKLGRIG